LDLFKFYKLLGGTEFALPVDLALEGLCDIFVLIPVKYFDFL
jgi:hypothetical protein